MRKFGVNVVTLLPRSWGANGLAKSVAFANRMGLDGVQAMPLRGWDYRELEVYSDKILSYQNSWVSGYEPGSQISFRQRIMDWIVFGRPTFPKVEGAVFTSPRPLPGAALEMHPERSVDQAMYIEHAQRGGSICWDTWHVRRKHGVTGETMGDWRKLLRDLPVFSLKLIHIHPTQEEIDDFLNWRRCELIDMIWALQVKEQNAPMIIEVSPGVQHPWPDRAEQIYRILDVTRHYLTH